MKIFPVIMAGGGGTRLWPLSTPERPKQFLNLSGRGSLLEETLKRVKPFNPEKILIVTSKKYESLSGKAVADSGLKGTLLSEPMPKNTAAAVLYAAIYLEKLSKDGIMLVMPADHYIIDEDKFRNVLEKAFEVASKGSLVTIGVKPARPETGFGYIKASGRISEGAYFVKRFVEKPDYETAMEFLNTGGYYWNSGIFVWRVDSIIKAFKKHFPEHLAAFEPMRKLSHEQIDADSMDTWNMKIDIFNSISSISIDKAILEKNESTSLIVGDFGWADLGSWQSVDQAIEPDENSNRTPDKEKAVFVNSENCSVFAEDSRISIVGLKNVTVVQSGNEILVIEKDSSQDVKKIMEKIRLNE